MKSSPPTVRAHRERPAGGDRARSLARRPEKPSALKAAFEQHQADLGFGLLLKKYVADVRQATPAMIDQAAADTIPQVAPMFWSFRLMVGLGFGFLLLFSWAWASARNWSTAIRGCCAPPWLSFQRPGLPRAGLAGRFNGRQPWTIYGILPTHLSTSTLSVGSILFSLAGFIVFYTGLFIAEMYLMLKYARLGPSSLGTGKYHLERQGA